MTEAADGAEALAICQRTVNFDLLITDVVMPHLGGPELVVEAKKIMPTLKVVFMSGYTDRAIDDKLKGPGTEFLQKPVSLDVFARTVRNILDTKIPPTKSENGQVQ